MLYFQIVLSVKAAPSVEKSVNYDKDKQGRFQFTLYKKSFRSLLRIV